MKSRIYLVLLLLCFTHFASAQDLNQALTVQKLAEMNPLPPTAVVGGIITSVDASLTAKTTYTVKLEKALTCEIQLSSAGENLFIEKQGDALVLFSKYQNTKKPPQAVKKLPIGASIIVKGILIKQPNGSVVLKGIAVAATGL